MMGTRLLAAGAAGAVAIALAAGALVREPGTPTSDSPSPRTAVRLPFAEAGPRRELAAALRRGDWAAALARLEPSSSSNREPATGDGRLLLGFAAHALGRLEEAERWLESAGEESAAARGLGDWRLFLLSDAAAGCAHAPAAQSALERLLRDDPTSPLRGAARLRLAELLAAEARTTEALAVIARGRDELALASESAAKLELLAWEIGSRTGDRPTLATAARRLLVLAPLEAARLQVAETLRSAGGTDWTNLLGPEELALRAAALLDLEIVEGAHQSLDAVPPATRDLRWHSLKARALVASHRATEALSLLAPLAPADPAGRLRLDWARAQAAAAAATAERGRANPPASARQRYRQLEREALQRAATLASADPVTGALVLRALYADLQADERIDEAFAALERLHALDPADTTGARHLWERGWREYRSRNFTGAIGFWAQLHALYPRSGHGRSARYWSAKSFAALGDKERAARLFREVAAASPADFYARQAALRLRAVGPPAAEESVAREPWPDDPLLGRARLFSDLGLDRLALAEIDLRAGQADPRGELALRGIALAHLGERRESLRLLRRAFPKLGTAFQAEVPLAAVELFYPLDFSESIRRAALAQQLSPYLVFAVIHQESAFDPKATSRSGARGLMQLMPGTGREVARQLGMPFSVSRLFEPEFSVRLGTTYLRRVLTMFGGNVELALAAYNGGPGRIQQLWRRAGPTPELDSFLEELRVEESKNYVKRILVLSDAYRQLYPNLG